MVESIAASVLGFNIRSWHLSATRDSLYNNAIPFFKIHYTGKFYTQYYFFVS